MYVNAVKITTIVDIDFFCQSLQFSVSSAQTPVIIIETFCEMNLIFRADNRITASPVVLRSSPSSPHFFCKVFAEEARDLHSAGPDQISCDTRLDFRIKHGNGR